MSSKQPVSRFRQVVEIEKPKNFDPRFKHECGGDFDEIKFQQNFNFLDDLRKTEVLVKKLLNDNYVSYNNYLGT